MILGLKNVSGIYIWLEIEWGVFLGTLLSNALFLALRSCFRHKIQMDIIPEKKQLPNVDTIMAIVEVANAFNAQCIPLVVSAFLYI